MLTDIEKKQVLKELENREEETIIPFKLEQPVYTSFSEKYITLLDNYYVSLSNKYSFIVPKLFSWDGASIPEIASTIVGQKMEPIMILPSLVHDYLYRNGKFGRKRADLIFYKLCILNGMDKVKARGMYNVLRMFGGVPYGKYKDRGLHNL